MRKVILFNLVIIIVGAAIYYFISNRNVIFNQENKTNNLTLTQYPVKSDSEGSVLVEVKPISLTTNEVKFNVELTTHSGDLSYDIVKIAKLVDENGKSYSALGWTGGSGGHHLSGELSFPPLAENTKTITLTIPQIGDKDRIFTWNLK